jgi:hypothetical protein
LRKRGISARNLRLLDHHLTIFSPSKKNLKIIGIKNFEMKKFPRERKLHQGWGHSQNAGLDSAIASS